MMKAEIIHPELWSIFGAAAFLMMLVFRLVVFRTSFLGRSLICFSAGLMVFVLLIFFQFDTLISIPDIVHRGSFDTTFILTNQEITVHYYYWYLLALAMAIGCTINFWWLLYDKWKYTWLSQQRQAKIFGLSLALGCTLVLLITTFFIT